MRFDSAKEAKFYKALSQLSKAKQTMQEKISRIFLEESFKESKLQNIMEPLK